VREGFAARAQVRMLLRGLQDAETGQRGFLLTRDERYLEPYSSARAVTEAQLALLEAGAFTEDRRADVRRLRDLRALKLEEIDETLALARSRRLAAAIDLVQTDRGKAIMDEFREIADRVERREEIRVRSSLAAVEANGANIRITILVAVLLLLVIGALMITAVRNAMLELRTSRDHLQAANERLTHEIASREQAETKVRQMQKMEAIGQLTGGIAHDFNNMLAVIISALQLAQRRMARGAEGAEGFIESAMDGARRAATLTARLLAFARRQPLAPSVLDVNKVLGGMSDLLRRTLGEQVEFETVLAGGLWRVNVDSSELENAIVNVCVNARDAMLDGGKLTIESANAYLDDTYAAANQDVTPGQYVMIAITDTGSGMPDDVRARAFDPFFTTKDVGKGTGLGLSHVHGFLKQSGGHVALYSELGIGTTVKLYMPRSQLQETEIVPAFSTDDVPQGDATTVILLVEDDERVRALSVTSLRELGYTVVHAESAERALEIIDKNEAIELLFTDVVMPGMSGRKLSEEARKRRPGLKVLYTTGYTQNAIVHNGVLDADARLLLKPYSFSELARKIRQVLDE